MDQALLFDILNRIMGVWGLLLICCSIIFNLLIFNVCRKSNKLRNNTTFKFLSIVAINDMLMCFPWNFDDFVGSMFNMRFYLTSLFYCEYVENFLQYITITFASWLLVSISLDRVLSLNIQKWSSKYFKGSWPFFYSLGLALIIISVNVMSVFKTGHIVRNENGSELVVCFEDSNGSEVIYNLMNEVFIFFLICF